MTEAWQDGLDYSSLEEPSEHCTPCGCKLCTQPAHLWVDWQRYRSLQGEGKVTYHELEPVRTVVQVFSWDRWIRRPPKAWVKWLMERAHAGTP